MQAIRNSGGNLVWQKSFTSRSFLLYNISNEDSEQTGHSLPNQCLQTVTRIYFSIFSFFTASH